VYKRQEQVVAVGCLLVVSDISPMGLLVAETAEIPSILIENFTWDWIYQGYPTYQQEFSALIEELQQRYAWQPIIFSQNRFVFLMLLLLYTSLQLVAKRGRLLWTLENVYRFL